MIPKYVYKKVQLIKSILELTCMSMLALNHFFTRFKRITFPAKLKTISYPTKVQSTTYSTTTSTFPCQHMSKIHKKISARHRGDKFRMWHVKLERGLFAEQCCLGSALFDKNRVIPCERIFFGIQTSFVKNMP